MIFFDLDGTLLDSNGVWLNVDNEFLGRRGLKPTQEYVFAVGHSIFPVAAQYTKDYYHLEDSPQSIMDEWRALAFDSYSHTIPLKPGAHELLALLQLQGHRMTLLTASHPDLCHAAVTHHKLSPYFEELFFAQDHGLEKRDPEIYRIAAAHFGVSPAHCVLLEDAPDNCLAARNAGFTVIGVYDDFYETRWSEVVQNSHHSVKTLEELLPFV